MTLGIDGLVSGLDTTSLINSIMQLDAQPQAMLKSKVSTTAAVISSLQGLNSSIASLATLATSIGSPNALDLFTANSTSAAVTATAAKGAGAGSIDLVVGQLAQSQVSVSAAMSAWPSSDVPFTITSAAGVATQITPATTSLDDVVSAINSSSAGVSALKVSAGNGTYRLQLSSTTTGTAGGFTVSSTAAGFTDTRIAQDAEVTLWAGSSASQTVTSATNTFSDLLPGVSVTVSAATTTPVTLTIARDVAQTSNLANSLVTSLNSVFSYISSRSAITTTTDASGVPTTSGGVFTGDGTVRDIGQRLLSAASMPVNGHSPSEYGISITETGTMSFDADKFASALASDPAGTEDVVQQLAARIQGVATAASDPYTGLLTTKITGQQSAVTDLTNQIADWDTRLANRRSSLEQTYANLEVQLNNIKSQSSWLSSQLAGLPSSGA